MSCPFLLQLDRAAAVMMNLPVPPFIFFPLVCCPFICIFSDSMITLLILLFSNIRTAILPKILYFLSVQKAALLCWLGQQKKDKGKKLSK